MGTKQAKSDKSYEELKKELDRIMGELQREDLGVDKAIEYYRRGLELVDQIEEYLETAENQVKELKAKPKP